MICTLFAINVKRHFRNGSLRELKDTCQECKKNFYETQVNSLEFINLLIFVQAGAMLTTCVKLKIFIDNDIHHDSGQNVLGLRGAVD